MSGAVRQLMEGCAVILGGFRKLLDAWERYAVAGGMIAGFVAVLMMNGHAAALYIIGNHSLGVLVCVGHVGKLGHMLCSQAFALGEMEDAVISQEGNLFFSCVSSSSCSMNFQKITICAFSPFLM